MSKKNRLKRREEYRKYMAQQNNPVEKPKTPQEIVNKNEYDMKPEFIKLGITILLFIGLLAGLYYYDKQTNVLEIAAKRLFSLLG